MTVSLEEIGALEFFFFVKLQRNFFELKFCCVVCFVQNNNRRPFSCEMDQVQRKKNQQYDRWKKFTTILKKKFLWLWKKSSNHSTSSKWECITFFYLLVVEKKRLSVRLQKSTKTHLTDKKPKSKRKGRGKIVSILLTKWK